MEPRTPPNNIEAEKAVIGTMLLNEKLLPIPVSGLLPEDFYFKQNIIIFTTISRLFKEGKDVDTVLVMQSLKESGELQSIDILYFASITDGVICTTLKSISSHVKIVKDASTSRGLIETARKVIEDCYGNVNIEQVQSDASLSIMQSAGQISTNSAKFDDVCGEVIANLKGRIDGTIKDTGIETGFYDLDSLINKLQKGESYVIAGRPSMGKTTIAMNILMNTAKNGAKCLVFSMEMTKKDLVENQLSSESGVPNTKIRSAKLNPVEIGMIENAAARLKSLKIRIDATASLRASQIQARAKMFAMSEGVDLILVDHIGLAKSDGAFNREREISEISMAMKCMAKDLDIPVISISQLNRECEKRDNKRPIASDLRDSGSVEQDADVIIMVYRDDFYNQESEIKGTCELILRKNRFGERDKTVVLNFNAEHCKFVNRTRSY